MKKPILFLLVAVLLSGCLPQDRQVPQSPLLPFLERKSGLIAYIGIDGNVYTSDQAGRNLTQVTDDAKLPDDQTGEFRFYQYPTWSADSSQLAMVGVTGVGDEQLLSELFVKTMEEDGLQTVCETPGRDGGRSSLRLSGF